MLVMKLLRCIKCMRKVEKCFLHYVSYLLWPQAVQLANSFCHLAGKDTIDKSDDHAQGINSIAGWL